MHIVAYRPYGNIFKRDINDILFYITEGVDRVDERVCKEMLRNWLKFDKVCERFFRKYMFGIVDEQ